MSLDGAVDASSTPVRRLCAGWTPFRSWYQCFDRASKGRNETDAGAWLRRHAEYKG